MLYFIAPDDQSPIGGTKQIYRHASILHDAGASVRVLHSTIGFVYDWFSHDAPLAYFARGLRGQVTDLTRRVLGKGTGRPSLELTVGREILLRESSGYRTTAITQGDVFVLPEYLGATLDNLRTSSDVVVFNQNAFYTFGGWGVRPRSSGVYGYRRTRGIICVSEHNRTYLTHAFPKLRVLRVKNGVDTSLFRYEPQDKQGNLIAFMPRKLGHHLEQVIQILHSRHVLEGWELMPIDGLGESEVAERLRRSSVFLSASNEEGFGLPPLEAMLCGCLVVGYTGSAGNEYFLKDLSWPVPQGDVLAFAQRTEEVLARLANGNRASEVRSQLFGRLSAEYDLRAERHSVLRAWRELCPDQFPS